MTNTKSKNNSSVSRVRFWVEVFALFVLPVQLIRLGVIPLSLRLLVLAGIFLAVLGIVLRERWTLKEIGLAPRRMLEGFRWYMLFLVLSIGMIFVLRAVLGGGLAQMWWTDTHFLFLFISLSVAQEFLFRGFLMARSKKAIASPLAIILLNAALFAHLHIIYPDALINVPITFAAGLVFAGIYYRYPNLVLISLVHAAINFFAVLNCFVSFCG